MSTKYFFKITWEVWLHDNSFFGTFPKHAGLLGKKAVYFFTRFPPTKDWFFCHFFILARVSIKSNSKVRLSIVKNMKLWYLSSIDYFKASNLHFLTDSFCSKMAVAYCLVVTRKDISLFLITTTRSGQFFSYLVYKSCWRRFCTLPKNELIRPKNVGA